jgi:hypothetical protein
MSDFPRIAWRVFGLDDDGVLVAPFVEAYWPLAGTASTWERSAQMATCVLDETHQPPAPDCSCGLTGVVKLANLMDAASSRGIDGSTRTILDDFGVIGKVELSGRLVDSVDPQDPPTTLRAERATVLELHCSPVVPAAVVQAAADRYPDVRVFSYTEDEWPKRFGAGERRWAAPTPEGIAEFLATVRGEGFGCVPREALEEIALRLGTSAVVALRGDASAEDLLSVLFRTEAAPTVEQARVLIAAAAEHLSPGLALAPQPYQLEPGVSPIEALGRSLGRMSVGLLDTIRR